MIGWWTKFPKHFGKLCHNFLFFHNFYLQQSIKKVQIQKLLFDYYLFIYMNFYFPVSLISACHRLIIQGSYAVWNIWKSMEFNFPFSRSWIVGNSELRYGKVWILGRFIKIFSMLNFCIPVYFSCNLMKFYLNVSEIDWNLLLKSKVLQGIFLYFLLVTLLK